MKAAASKKSFWSSLQGRYGEICLIFANIVFLFILLNIVLGIVFFIKDELKQKIDIGSSISRRSFDQSGAPLNEHRTAYQKQWFDYTAYEDIVNEQYADTVLDDFTNLSVQGFSYQPWVQFSEPLYNGKLVHVDADPIGLPIRRTISNATQQKTLRLRIFTFGGSTTFGYNVSDEHSWPSYLSAVLNKRAQQLNIHDISVEVTNYGRGYYYTTQEIILLMQILKHENRPDLVIFLDGVNEDQLCKDAPFFTNLLQDAMHNLQFEAEGNFINKMEWLPIVRLAKAVRQRFGKKVDTEEKSGENSDDCYTTQNGLEDAIQYGKNISLVNSISKLYGFKALILLQPDAEYNYELELYRNVDMARAKVLPRRPYKQAFYDKARNTESVVDLTNLFEIWGSRRKAIVDDVHYSPKFNQFLALRVADLIDLSSSAQNVQHADK